jgi:hypothetical protein
MPGLLIRAAFVAVALVAATGAYAQRHHRRPHREAESPAVSVSIDKRDSVVPAPGAFSGRPFWLALAQCGGIYFKLNVLYTDAAVHARVVKPDPRANAEFTKKLNEAITLATAYFKAAESFLMTDRAEDRDAAVLTYDGPSRSAGERLRTIDAALGAATSCPALYHACEQAYPKACSGPLAPSS